MRTKELDKLEDVKVSFGKRAFTPKVMYCDKDDSKMKRTEIDFSVSKDIKVKLNVFRCPKCKYDFCEYCKEPITEEDSHRYCDPVYDI